MPASHFPTKWVRYPAAASLVAIPVMLRAMPAMPDTGSRGLYALGSVLTTLTWMGLRPDWMLDRVGEPGAWAGDQPRGVVGWVGWGGNGKTKGCGSW